MSSSNSKVKGLLKGLRFISQIFENDKEPEIEIGLPTDVKHVAHIGIDSNHYDNSSLTWMDGVESIPRMSSASLDLNEDIHNKRSYNSGRQANEESKRGGSCRHVGDEGNNNEREISSRSRRQSTGNMRECQAKEKSDRPRQPKKPSKHHSKDSSTHVTKSTQHLDSSQLQQDCNNNNNNNNMPPKKFPSKLTTKDGSIDSSKSRAQTKDPNDQSSQHRRKEKSFEKDAQIEIQCNEKTLRNYPN